MRLLSMIAGACLMPMAALAQAPDAAPSTPVETVAMPSFEPTREEAVLEAFVDGAVAAHMRDHDIPGVTVSIVQNGRTVFAKGYGVADADGARAVSGGGTLFLIGSVSKTFIWTSVMMLVERGEINLEADVNVYLKDLQIPEKFNAPITMNDLMAHRAGFEDTLALFTVSDDTDRTLTELLNEHMPARVYPPGARTSYSNWGSVLAAKIVEDVSGVPYEQFLQDEILTPLGMDNTVLYGTKITDSRLAARRAAPFKVEHGWPAESEYMQIGPYAPAGGMASTAQDMSRWMAFHLGAGELDGVRLLSRATHERMLQRAFRDRSAGADLAHGFITATISGQDTFGHAGGTNAFYTNMVMFPGLDAGVFVSQNATVDRGLVSDLPALVADHLGGGVPRGPVAVNNAPASDYAGTYLNNRRSFTRFEKLFAAPGLAMVTPNEDGGVIIATQGETTLYKPVSGALDVFEDRYGQRVIFARNAQGRVTHFSDTAGIHSFDRAGPAENPQLLNAALGLALLFSITTWLGAWRRFGRGASETATGAMLGLGALAAAALTVAFAGGLVSVVATLSSATAATLQAYPPLAVTVTRMLALILFFVGLAALAGLWPAWMRSGWGVFRKAHYTLFALSLGALAAMLVVWNFVFAPTI